MLYMTILRGEDAVSAKPIIAISDQALIQMVLVEIARGDRSIAEDKPLLKVIKGKEAGNGKSGTNKQP